MRSLLAGKSLLALFMLLFVARGFVTARAFASPNTLRSFTRQRGAGASSISLLFSKRKEGEETGWNHNLPDNDDINGASSNKDKKKEHRTGWLHRRQPRVKKEKKQTSQTSAATRRLQNAMKLSERNHRMVAPPSLHACGDGRQVAVTEHKISLPIFRRYNQREPRMDIFFTIAEVVKTNNDVLWFKSLTTMSPTERAQAYVEKAAMTNGDDMILYLQGGPGFGAPSPIVGLGLSSGSSWGAKALDKYQRVVLMDQRGTGRSTPVTKQSLEKQFPDLFLLDTACDDSSKSLADFGDAKEYSQVQKALTNATDYMAQLRADNIVRDAEDIKDALMLPSETDDVPRPYGAVLGQSFGGFCIMTYLSQIAHPPRVCLLTGGIAPMLTPVFEVYDSLWERVKERSLRYYEMYPGDIAVVKRIVNTLLEQPADLPSGGKLTARRFLNLGLALGSSPSTFASLHGLFASTFLDDDSNEFSRAFLKRIDSEQSFDDHPIYCLLHESIYADGPKNSPTNWAAHRAYESRIKTPSEFDYKLTSVLDSDDRPTLFFGEMVFPWFTDGDFAEVSGLGMKSLANALAEKQDWEPLYDGKHMKRVLADGSISRAAAAVYYEDLYVDFDACMKVASRGGPLEKCKLWISNEYQHSGLRDNGAEIFSKLLGMATGSVRTPS